ncbi:hypothetical protein K439DRAFT_1659210 [Ramaria rubella]|nr:hypothetical protein K439DRAFT_1659210 [Ramaria rubella]
MPSSTFSVFLDAGISQVTSITPSTSFRKPNVHLESTKPATKENINPLTGLSFDAQPPLKKRKPSSSSALKVKPLPSSSKPGSKLRKLSSATGISKAKGKKKMVLSVSEAKNVLDGNEEQSRTALGNRRAYEFTVMPLANVTQAYDETEATRCMSRANVETVESQQYSFGMIPQDVTEEIDIEMCDISTSKEALQLSAITTES